MEEVAVRLDNNTRDDDVLSKLRSLFLILAKNKPKIHSIKFLNLDGDIQFSVNTKDQGLEATEFIKYRSVLFSPLVANFWGEMLLRENIDLFAPLLTSLGNDQYASAVNGFEHNKFGMHMGSGNLVFMFHASLLQSILTEDFKIQIKSKV